MHAASVLEAAAMDAAIASCALEPIHTPGATQPFGAAIVVDAASRITHVSRSASRILGAPAGALLGVDVREAFASQLAGAWVRLSRLRADQTAIQRVVLSGRELDPTVWRRPDGATVLSFVPGSDEVSVSPVEELAELQRDLGATSSLEQLCDRAAALIRELSGYDRVMVYQFDAAARDVRRAYRRPGAGLATPDPPRCPRYAALIDALLSLSRLARSEMTRESVDLRTSISPCSSRSPCAGVGPRGRAR